MNGGHFSFTLHADITGALHFKVGTWSAVQSTACSTSGDMELLLIKPHYDSTVASEKGILTHIICLWVNVPFSDANVLS